MKARQQVHALLFPGVAVSGIARFATRARSAPDANIHQSKHHAAQNHHDHSFHRHDLSSVGIIQTSRPVRRRDRLTTRRQQSQGHLRAVAGYPKARRHATLSTPANRALIPTRNDPEIPE